jgi:hypothetical protein
MKLFVLALNFGSFCRFKRKCPSTVVWKCPSTVVSVLVQYMRGGLEGGWGWVIGVVIWVGYVAVGIAGYRSLKMDPFTSSARTVPVKSK